MQDESIAGEVIRLYLAPLPDGTWMGAPTIARRFGISPQTVYNYLARAGVPTRDSSTALTGKPSWRLKNVGLNLISLCFACHPRGREADRLAPKLVAIAAAREGVII